MRHRRLCGCGNLGEKTGGRTLFFFNDMPLQNHYFEEFLRGDDEEMRLVFDWRIN